MMTWLTTAMMVINKIPSLAFLWCGRGMNEVVVGGEPADEADCASHQYEEELPKRPSPKRPDSIPSTYAITVHQLKLHLTITYGTTMATLLAMQHDEEKVAVVAISKKGKLSLQI